MKNATSKPWKVTNNIGQTQCSICKLYFPTSIAFFKPSKVCSNGLVGTCRSCRNQYSRLWKKSHPELAEKRRLQYHQKQPEFRKKEKIRVLSTPILCRARVIRKSLVQQRNRGIIVEPALLSVPYLRDWLTKQDSCECCGRKFKMQRFLSDRQGPSDDSPSIDRFIPSKGYVLENVSLLCWRCNNLKRDASVKELETITLWMRKKVAL